MIILYIIYNYNKNNNVINIYFLLNNFKLYYYYT